MLANVSTVIVYTTDMCGSCAGAKKLLEKRGIVYEEVNLSRDPDGRAELQRATGMFTFPQVIVGERAIGGFNELLAADRAGRLAELLRPPQAS
jgi:glutaredoxin 3